MHLIRKFIARLESMDWMGDNRIPFWTTVILALIAFFGFLGFIAGSDYRELALNRLQDDSYYYLQPAWLLPREGFFTFDGENPTYGFQPLWMLLLSIQRLFTPDKIIFLRTAVALGAFFYCLAGIALQLLTREWTPGWRSILAPALWLINPPLAAVFLTGKENALYAFLLIASAALVCRFAGRMVSWRIPVVTGVFLGLTVLSRVNALAPAALLGGVFIFFAGGGWRWKLSRAGWLLAGASLVLIPWGLYAVSAFGTVFPNSGSAKLIGAWAGALHFLGKIVPLDSMVPILPPTDQALYFHPEVLALPTTGLAESFFLGFLPETAVGFWRGLVLPLELTYKIKLLTMGVGLVAGLTWMLAQWRPLRSRLPVVSRRGGSPVAAAVLGVIMLSAAVNGGMNWLLLPAYLYWGLWYAVPETVFLVMLAALVCGIVADGLMRLPWARIQALVQIGLASGATVILTVACLRFLDSWQPRAYLPAADRTQHEVFEGVLWMNHRLPDDARVGSFSGGLLGYFAEGFQAVNVDGLANTPAFVDEILPGHILFTAGLRADSPLPQYLKKSGITFFANYDTIERIQSGLYWGLWRGEIVFQGEGEIDWGGGEPLRKFILVEINEK